eukprot:12919890-Prorocentrum_lima.AAC.1
MILSLTNGHLETLTTTDINWREQGCPGRTTPNSFQVGNSQGRYTLEDSKDCIWTQGELQTVAGRT